MPARRVRPVRPPHATRPLVSTLVLAVVAALLALLSPPASQRRIGRRLVTPAG